MKEPVKPRRPYDSPRRREHARDTRRAILDAARTSFIEAGYVATTIEAIAARAGVSPESIYAIFRNKRTLLSALVDVSIAGDDAATPVLQRDWVEAMRADPDPRARLGILVRNGRLILERRSAIDEVVRGAAAADPEIATLWAVGKEQRHAGQLELLRIVVGGTHLRAGLTLAAAADILFAIGSPETYRLLVVDRGWSGSRFERWYEEALARLLFD